MDTATSGVMESTCSVENQDLTLDRLRAFLLWGLPYLCFFIGIFGGPVLRTVLWTSSLCVAGTACLVNASRCGRFHCYFTGPFYLLMAILSVMYGVGLLDIGAMGWVWIGGIIVILTPVLNWLPERIYGRYVKEKQ